MNKEQSTEDALKVTAFADPEQKKLVSEALVAIYARYPAFKTTKGN